MDPPDRRIPVDLTVPLASAAVVFALHFVANPHYGFFRDELYFIICGRRPDWGYVDQPPLVPLLAAGSQILGHSLVALRAVAAMCASVSIFATVLLVQQLGGGAFAGSLAAAVAALTPVLTAFGGKVGPDMVMLAAWPLAAYYVMRLIRDGDPRLWLAVFATLGAAGQGKYSVLFFAAAMLAGVALTAQRRIMATWWFPAGMALGALVVLPNVLWQARHGFPMLELLHNGQHGKNIVLSPGAYLFQQLVLVNPLLAPVYLLGLPWSFRQPCARWIGWTYVLLMAMMIALHGKNYYPGSVYAIVAAPGALAIETWTAGRGALRSALITLAVILGAWIVPFVEPILPVPAFVGYRRALASFIPTDMSSEHHRPGQLPQDWADMQGWPELAKTVARVYLSLPPWERAKVAIVAANYGEAAAIDFFGERYGLPPVLSGHNNYWLWGTRGYTGEIVIDVHGDCGADEHLFRSSVKAATFSNPLGMPYEDNIAIMLCRGINRPLWTIWPAVKNFI